MQSFPIYSKTKIKKAIPLIEAKLKVKVSLRGSFVVVEGNQLQEYFAVHILQAVDFGFEMDDALMLANPNFTFELVNMRDHTKKHNLVEVRARVIGTNGKAKRTIETLSGARVVVHGDQVGIISDSEHLESVTQAVVLLIQGSKHANVFAYLEKQNVNLRNLRVDDLGIKDEFKKFE